MIAALLAATALQITVWPQGPDEGKQVWTLRCGPAGGTLPHARSACSKLARLQHPFAPVPADVACIEIYGGPQEALVVGRFRGQRIRVRFNRRDGCEIERWNRVRFLLEPRR